MSVSLKSKWMRADFATLVVRFVDGTMGPMDCYIVRTRGRKIVKMGMVEYCVQWKHWVFVPEAERQFSNRCLSDLARFLDELNKERKMDKAFYESLINPKEAKS